MFVISFAASSNAQGYGNGKLKQFKRFLKNLCGQIKNRSPWNMCNNMMHVVVYSNGRYIVNTHFNVPNCACVWNINLYKK